MMRVDIHDVGHGGCAVVTCPNGARIMLDCGFNSGRWYPSAAYAGQFVDLLVFTNLDKDHVEDFVYLRRNVRLGSIFSNSTVTARALAAMKHKHGMDAGVQEAHSLLSQFGPGLIGTIANVGDVEVWGHWNRYGIDFMDTNNLSVATFIRWGSFSILFAGDLETAGWRALLRIPSFVARLATVKVLVASHHGRTNGQCSEAFNVMRPEIVVFSDEKKQHETQESDAWYRARVSGIPDLRARHRGLIPPKRHVLTTRRDGTVTIQVDASGRYLVTPERNQPQTPPFRLPLLHYASTA